MFTCHFRLQPRLRLFHPISFLLFEREGRLTGREREADENRQRREETEGKKRGGDTKKTEMPYREQMAG